LKYFLLIFLLQAILIPFPVLSELICERPDGCPWINGECIGCISKRGVSKTSESLQGTPGTTIENLTINYSPTVSETHYVITRPPTLILSNPNLHITSLSRDNRGWRFRVSNGSFECLLSPLNPSDVRGNISCGGVESSFSVFF
jgi:hypothetical protein